MQRQSETEPKALCTVAIADGPTTTHHSCTRDAHKSTTFSPRTYAQICALFSCPSASKFCMKTSRTLSYPGATKPPTLHSASPLGVGGICEDDEDGDDEDVATEDDVAIVAGNRPSLRHQTSGRTVEKNLCASNRDMHRCCPASLLFCVGEAHKKASTVFPRPLRTTETERTTTTGFAQEGIVHERSTILPQAVRRIATSTGPRRVLCRHL